MAGSIFRSNGVLGNMVFNLFAIVLLKYTQYYFVGVPDPIVFSFLLKQFTLEPLLAFTLSGLVLFTQSLQIDFLANYRGFMASKNRYFGGFLILFSFLIPEWSSWGPILVGNSLLLFMIQKTMQLYGVEKTKAKVFDLGILISLGCLVHPIFYFSIPLWIFGVAAMGAFNIKNLLIFLGGVLTPIYFMLSIGFLLGSSQTFLNGFFESFQVLGTSISIAQNPLSYVVLIWATLCSFAGLLSFGSFFNGASVQARLYMQFFLVIFGYFILLVAFLPYPKEVLFCSLIPFFSYFSGKFLMKQPFKLLGDLSLFALLGVLVLRFAIYN
jgi:hypothetical protein